MRLEIGSNIDNKRVRLDFRKDNTRAVYMPSYQIKTANADEFVTKYNKQSSSLKKLTAVLVCGLAILGGIFGVKSEKKQNCHARYMSFVLFCFFFFGHPTTYGVLRSGIRSEPQL